MSWNIIMIILLLYTVVYVPYNLAFMDPSPLYSVSWVFDLLIDIFFLTDILINFHTPQYNEDGKIIIDK